MSVKVFRCFILFLLIQPAYAKQQIFDFFKQPEVIAEAEHIDLGLNEEQKIKAEQFEQEQQDYSILRNKFYENDRIKIENFSAYQMDHVQEKYASGLINQTNLNDLTLSLGYAIIFKINAKHRIGYEYISTFPYDRGQIVRIFWASSF